MSRALSHETGGTAGIARASIQFNDIYIILAVHQSFILSSSSGGGDLDRQFSVSELAEAPIQPS